LILFAAQLALLGMPDSKIDWQTGANNALSIFPD
jgi:hypothetical protein